MLETIRKHHYVLMCVIAGVVIVAFAFLYDPNRDKFHGDRPIVTLNGQDFHVTDLREIDSQRPMITRLVATRYAGDQMGSFMDPLFQYLQTMSSVVNRYQSTSQRDDEVDLDYVMNVTILRQQAAKLGVHVEKEDLERFVQTLEVFKTNGQFDGARYASFLESGFLGDRVTTERRLFLMLRDVMYFQKLNSLIGGELAPSKAEVDFLYADRHQVVTAVTALVEKSKQPEPEVTQEEIQKYYDEQKAKAESPAAADPTNLSAQPDARLMSPEKRAVRYVLINLPSPPPEPVAPATPDTTGFTEEQKKAKEEEYQKLLADYEKAKAEHSAKVTEVTNQAQELRKKAGDLSNALSAEDRGGKSFEQLAKELGLEPVLTEPFAQASPPDALKQETSVVRAIFESDTELNESYTINSKNGYALFEVTEIQKPAILPLEEVKDKIVSTLKEEKTNNALQAAADTARSKILEATQAGKSFKDAATENGLTVTEVPAFSQSKPATGVANLSVVTRETKTLNPGETSQPIEVPEGRLLVHLVKKELPHDPNMEEEKRQIAQARTVGGANMSFFTAGNPLFSAWFSARRNEAVEVSQVP